MSATIAVRSQRLAKLVCHALIERSAWFELLPLPDDYWSFSIKQENFKWLSSLVIEFEGTG